MDLELAKLTVVLKALNIPLSVDSKEDRLIMQKAICLAQGFRDLGYRFSWYLNGPYSPELADNYYAAAARYQDYARFNADPETIAALEPVVTIVRAKPGDVCLADWIEAAGSLYFMRNLLRRDHERALSICKDRKPHLTTLFDLANEKLPASGF